MELTYYIEKLWYKAIYAVFVVVYLIHLNKLNKELNAQNFSSAFMLLEYKDCVALKFFALAILFFAVGCCLICHEIRKLRIELDDGKEMIIAIATIFVVIILLFLIIMYINNPILRAILTAVFVIAAGAAVVIN